MVQCLHTRMRKIDLGKTGEQIPVLGQGTWGIDGGKRVEWYDQWKASLRKGIELGMTHIDTAEAYGFGASEKVVGEIIKEYGRDELFITSKLLPLHITKKSMEKAIDKTLQLLGIPTLDLFLIHWPNPLIPTKKHIRIMESFVKAGKTRYIGVSNFSVKRFKVAQQAVSNTEIVNNQIHINIAQQGHVGKSLPYYQKEGVTVSAWSPLGHSGFKNLKEPLKSTLEKVAQAHDVTIHQIAIAWVVSFKNVFTIPKAFKTEHVEANAAAAEIQLSEAEMHELTECKEFELASFDA